MSGHTPAPWTLGNENNDCCDVDTGTTRISLDRADPFTGVQVISREEMLANARVVVAAPTMHALLVECLANSPDQGSPWRRRVEEVLAEVRGGK